MACLWGCPGSPPGELIYTRGSKIHVHLKPPSVTLFRNRVFQGVTKVTQVKEDSRRPWVLPVSSEGSGGLETQACRDHSHVTTGIATKTMPSRLGTSRKSRRKKGSTPSLDSALPLWGGSASAVVAPPSVSLCHLSHSPGSKSAPQLSPGQRMVPTSHQATERAGAALQAPPTPAS